jgi:type I restriction enzyme S subunit
MRKYQSYKQSGVEWIGEIPSHWDFIKTNILTENLDGKRVPLNSEERGEMEGEYPYWGSNGVVDYVNQFIFNEEIVLVGEDGSPFFDKLKDVSFYVNEPVWVNNHIHILKPKDRILPKYLTHSFNCVDYKEYITGSTRDKLTQSDLKRISHCVPPIQEQIQIVQYLDEKIDLIDRFISIKERKISLLKEQRTSLINQVVTKGLNSNVKLKDSGSEFIGKIPESWKCTKLGFYTKKIGSGSTPRGGSEVYVDSGVPFVRSQNVHFDGLRLDGVSFIDFETHKSMKGSTVVRGDVLLNITGGSIGRCCVVEEDNEMNVNQHVSIIRTTVELLNYYLNYLLGSDIGQSQVLFNLTGGNREGLTIEGIRNFFITIPNLTEQLEIVKHIEFKNKEIDDLVHLEQKKINLLKEYRQSLISEVVTGKIKVTTDE